MTVYLLQLKITYSDEVIESRSFKSWHFSHCDVFTEQKHALSAGRKIMNAALRDLKDEFPRCKKESIADFVKENAESEELYCEFEISGFDPNAKRRINGTDSQLDRRDQWIYDYRGKLREKWEWINGLGYRRMEGDDAEDAGTKFALGDFVTVRTEIIRYKDKIFVVGAQPGKKSEWKNPGEWENIYELWSIENRYGFHGHFHEAEMRLYKKEIPEDHPLRLLRRMAAGEVPMDEKTYSDLMFEGNILLDYPPDEAPSWRTLDLFGNASSVQMKMRKGGSRTAPTAEMTVPPLFPKRSNI